MVLEEGAGWTFRELEEEEGTGIRSVSVSTFYLLRSPYFMLTEFS